jgi:predicted nucleic acid-binding protein
MAPVHIHNAYHNAYVYIPYASDATGATQKLIENAIELLKSSKSSIEKAPSPKISMEYKNQNTNITLAMASSNFAKTHIYYTLDGTDPTESSTEYTDVINVTSETTVKAVAIAEGYLLSDVASAVVRIYAQPATPAVSCDYQDGQTVVSLSCETADADIWYNYTEGNDTTKSMKYSGAIVVKLPTTLNVFSVVSGQVFSETAQQRIVVKNVVVRQDQIGLFDANAADYQNGGGSTVYYFSWGKNAASIYDDSQPGTTTTNPETGDEETAYPERDYEVYVPAAREDGTESAWEVKSKGQVMIWQSITAGSDPGNANGYNPETSGDIVSYAKITNNDVQFGGKASGEPCTGVIQSRKKFLAPFDIVTIVGTAAGGENVGRMQVEASADGLEWTKVGDEMATSTVKRLWKTYTRSYDGSDEVYVRLTQAGGGSSVQIYNIYILNEGENSLALKEQYNQEFTGITDVKSASARIQGVYNLSGIRQNGLQRGLNIVVGSDGKAKKVLR